MNCRSCQTECPEGQKFCTNCGTELGKQCHECGKPVTADDKFCSGCGTPQIRDEAERSADADRRPITALFCDLVGSTDLSTTLDPEDLRDIISTYQERSSKIVSSYGGFLSRFMGDGILVLYSYPVAQEDAAERSIHTGLELVRGISSIKTSFDRPLEVRIGIATGVAIVGDLIGEKSSEQRNVVGETPNLAARLQAVAKPNQIVVANGTYNLVKGLFDATDLGKIELKGFPEPQACWLINRAIEMESRFEMTHQENLVPLVGRSKEIALLKACLNASKNGAGQVALVTGDPGIGKSRLIQEVRTLAASEKFSIASFSCSPMQKNTALWPIIQFLQRSLGLNETNDNAAKLQILETQFEKFSQNPQESIQLLASLLQIELPADKYPALDLLPQMQRSKTHDLLSTWITRLSASSPMVTIWEDLHWADPSTIEVLTMVIAATEVSQQLQLLSFRPEFQPPWRDCSYMTTITLQPLNSDQIKTLIKEFATRTLLPPDVIQSLVERSDGVPLFAEELAQMMVDQSTSGATMIGIIEIPSSIHDSLISRLDQLSSARKFAQVASVVGREFDFNVLQHLFDVPEEEISASLNKLVDSQILIQKGFDQDAQYQFRHALIQDAAYNSMLKKERQSVHLQIADMYEGEFQEVSTQAPEILAHHLTEAGESIRAIGYWQQAGTKAHSRFDNVEAVNQLKTALDLIQGLPSTPENIQIELGILLLIGVPLTAIRSFGSEEVGAVYGRARDITLAMDGGDPRLHFILNGLYRYYFVRGDGIAAHDIAKRLSELAESSKESGQLVYAHQALSFTEGMLGDISTARTLLQKVDETYQRDEHLPLAELYGADVYIAARTNGAVVVLFTQGELALARDWMSEALTLARDAGNPFEMAWSFNYAAVGAQQFDDVEATLDVAQECIDVSTQYEMPYWLAGGKILRAWAQWRGGDVEKGIDGMRQGIHDWQATGAGIFIPYYKSLLLNALIEEGRFDEGEETYTSICEHVSETQEQWWDAEIERLHGELVAKQAAQDPALSDKARDILERSVEIAHSRGQRTLELRAKMSLVRLQDTEQRLADLKACLAHFNESQSSPDLDQARELLA